MSKTILFQIIQFSIQKQFHFNQVSLAYVCSLNFKKVLFQAIQISINIQFSSIWPIDRTLSGATTPGKSGLGSDGNKEVLRVSQSSSITGTSPSDCLVSYPEHSLGVSFPLQRSSRCILQPQLTEPRFFSVIFRTLVWWGGFYPTAVKQSVYSTASSRHGEIGDYYFTKKKI